MVVLPAPLGPSSPKTVPSRDLEVDSGDRLVLAVRLAQAADPDYRIPPIPGRAIVARSHHRLQSTNLR